ncbi:hypothetical protein SOCEGT47_026490 [Sorangium cellulosum]|uniref:Uncharacterized protein n=1 Tax=Sorangium cellulosum TaxID=56 RepID=A0A4P2PZT3_SORCE|nr:hypothetical protein [Sorangium cellulosum]AUX22148.1 hypothetical protein SOCEGT47_026490 [Sorangium cellulosum]
MISEACGIAAWPSSLVVEEVQRHKSALIDEALRRRAEGGEPLARVAFRGALYWQRWLLTKEPGLHEEARVVSGLEFAREAGDWKEADLLVAHADASRALAELPFVEHWKRLVAEHLPEQVSDEQELEEAFQGFRRHPSEEAADNVKRCAGRIAPLGSPVPVHTILARVAIGLGRTDEAEFHLAALVVCRPLWIPYVVQLAEHQAKLDLPRALRSIETARSLFGPDFWLPL